MVEPTLLRLADPGQTPDIAPPGLELLTITEAAEVLGVSRETVRLRVRRGKMAATKLNGQWYVHLDNPAPTTRVRPRVRVAVDLPVETLDRPGSDPGLHEGHEPGQTDHGVVRASLAVAEAEVRRLETTVGVLQQECDRLHDLLRAEQETRRREVSELHVLLQRAQAQIPLPTAAAQPVAAPPAEPVQRRRRWWWPW